MYYFGPMDAFCRRRFQALLNRSDVNNRSPTTARSSPTRARSPRSSARAGRDEAVLLRPPPQRPEGSLRAKPRRAEEAPPKGAGLRFDRLSAAEPGARHVARELGAPRRARLLDARVCLQGDARGGRSCAAARLRRGGRAHRRARPDAGAHRAGVRREGRRPEHGHRTHRNTSPLFFQLGKRRPRGP